MKKFVKIFLLLCITILTLSVLCSCNVVDELKEQRINFVDGEDRNYNVTILEYKGVQYKKLINKANKQISFDNDIRCYAVEKDIPLLLIQDIGYSARYDKDKDVIRYAGDYFCHPDKYKEYSMVINSGVTENFRSIEYVVDEEKKQVYTQYYVINDDATLAINDAFINKVGRKYDEAETYDWDFVDLDSCDKTNFIIDDKYRVRLYHDTKKDSYGVVITPGDGTFLIKEIDEKWWGEMAEIFEKADFDLAYAKAYGFDIDLDYVTVEEAF